MNYYFIETKNSNYVLDIRRALIYRITPEYKQRIKKLNEENIKTQLNDLRVEDAEIIDFYNQGDIFVKHQMHTKMEKRYGLESMTFILTSACNLKCKYCYGAGEWLQTTMDYKKAKTAIDFLLEHRASSRLTIIFFGGEPLLNYSLMEQIVFYCKEIEQSVDVRFDYSITTNGTMIDEKTASFFKENNFHINVSIDGDKETHDKCRYNSSGQGTYDAVVQGIHKISPYKRTARGTMTKNNTNVYELFHSLESIGFFNIHFEIVTSGEKEIRLGQKDIDNYIKKYKDLCKEAFNIIVSGESNWKSKIYGPIKDDLEKLSQQTFRTHFCKAAKQYVAVDTDGRLYPCHRYIGNPLYSIGDIVSGFNTTRNRYINSDIFSKKRCESCWIRYLCGGGCDNEAEMLNGDITIPVAIKCEIRKRMLHEALVLYLKLREEGMENLDEMFSN